MYVKVLKPERHISYYKRMKCKLCTEWHKSHLKKQAKCWTSKVKWLLSHHVFIYVLNDMRIRSECTVWKNQDNVFLRQESNRVSSVSIFLAMCIKNKYKSVYLSVIGIHSAPEAVSLRHSSTVAPWGGNLLAVKVWSWLPFSVIYLTEKVIHWFF